MKMLIAVALLGALAGSAAARAQGVDQTTALPAFAAEDQAAARSTIPGSPQSRVPAYVPVGSDVNIPGYGLPEGASLGPNRGYEGRW